MGGENESVYINGKAYKVECDPRSSLVDFIRNQAGLKGTKAMCREGGCGVCIVTVTRKNPISGELQRKSINSCLATVGSVIGQHVTTIEGLGSKKAGFHPIQKSVAEHHGSQCGFCTPGMIMNMYGFSGNPSTCDADLERSFDGVLCRCTGYRAILQAAKDVKSEFVPQKNVLDIEDIVGCCKKKAAPPKSCALKWQDTTYHKPTDIKEVFNILDQDKTAKIIFGNTAGGYLRKPLVAKNVIDIRQVEAINKFEVKKGGVTFGASITIQDMIKELGTLATENAQQFQHFGKVLVPLLTKAGGQAMRNTASWAGNLMVRHKHHTFISDLFVYFEGLQARIAVATRDDVIEYIPAQFLCTDMSKKVITSITLPALDHATERFHAFKIMPREAMTLAVLNGSFYIKTKPDSNVIEEARIVIGGIALNLIRAVKTENLLKDKSLNKDTIIEAVLALKTEVTETGCKWRTAYKEAVVTNLLNLFLKSANPQEFSADEFYKKMSSATHKKEETSTVYEFEKKVQNYPENEAMPNVYAMMQCSGETQYMGDKAAILGELQAYCVLSQYAKADITIDTAKAKEMEGVVAVLTAADIPGQNCIEPPIVPCLRVPALADKKVQFAGQPVAIVVAETHDLAVAAAKLVQVKYSNVEKPILDISESVEKNYRHEGNGDKPFKTVTRGDVAATMSKVEHKVEGTAQLNAQYHFPMETHVCLAQPYDDMLDIWMTSQGPAIAQQSASMVTGMQMSSINVHVLRLGGAFGGKAQSSRLVSALCSMAAVVLHRPVRMTLSLDHSLKMFGTRPPMLAKYQAGYNDDGKIQCINVDIYQDCGFIKDEYSYLILPEMCTNMETVYHVPHWDVKGHMMKTDKPWTVACRSPLALSPTYIMETIMEHVAFDQKKDPILLKEMHLIKDGDPCLYGGVFENTPKLWDDMKTEAKLDDWKKSIQEFNAANPHKKRGLAVTPSRTPFMYVPVLNFSAYVTVYAHDGTVSVTHGGVDMGQGLNTKVIQIVARTLGVDMNMVKTYSTMSLTSANDHYTAGSLGSECVSRSVLECCKKIKAGMDPVREQNPDKDWVGLVMTCYATGVELAASCKYNKGAPLNIKAYHTFGIVAVEAEVNMLTGEHTLNRADVVFDVGESMNPTVDIGQIEGGLAMGLGYYRSEKMLYDKDTGLVLSNGTWDYKIQTSQDIPTKMNIHLMKGSHSHNGMMPSKAIGEPPVNCGCVVMFAVKNALQEFRLAKNLKSYFTLEQPLSLDEILEKSEKWNFSN